MMRIVLYISILFCLCPILSAQDIIILESGDTIDCEITKLSKDFIHFDYSSERKLKKSIVAKDKVKSFEKDYFEDSVQYKKALSLSDSHLPKYRLGVSIGYGKRIDEIVEGLSPKVRSYVEDLLQGPVVGLDYSMYWSKHLGMGLNYRLFHSSSETTDINNSTRTEINRINYYFPSVNFRWISKNQKVLTSTNFGLGYMTYRGIINDGEDGEYEGEAVGFSTELEIDLMISQNLSFGLEGALLAGTISMFQVYDGTTWKTIWLEEEKEGLSRIDLSMGIKYYLRKPD